MVLYYRLSVTELVAFERNERGFARKRKVEKTLLVLTLCQSIFTSIDMAMFSIYYTLAYTVPTFLACVGKIVGPICDGVLSIAGIAEFFAMIAVSKGFRKTLLSNFPYRKASRSSVTVSGVSRHGEWSEVTL